MKSDKQKILHYEFTLQGFLLGMIPLTLLGVYADNPLLNHAGGLVIGVLVPLLLGLGLWRLFLNPVAGRSVCAIGILLGLFQLGAELFTRPLLALVCLLPAVAGLYYTITARLVLPSRVTEELRLSRFYGSGWALLLFTMLSPLLGGSQLDVFKIGCLCSFLWMLVCCMGWLRHTRKMRYPKLMTCAFVLIGLGALYLTGRGGIMVLAFILALAALTGVSLARHPDMKLLEVILQHPARCLVLTFLALCTVGTLVLRTPMAMARELSLLNAAFTSVSGVCVTGLSVIDIASELTMFGRFLLLMLIQLGGLGIMTLTSLVLYALGRLSMNQEQLIAELTTAQERNRDVYRNLRLIVLFTFTVEAVGALLLTLGFYSVHGSWATALELGIFTSISAFCNAGFFPGAASLEPYAGESFILLTVALLIIAGGIAPAVSCSLWHYRSFRKLPVVCKLIFGTTAALLFGGTFFLLLFEWNGMFSGLPLADKLVNGFFQSATLRTAGFNTVSFSAIGVPAYLIVLILMFIGGSPGGTAGGIKTTALAVLVLSFRAALRNEDTVSVDWRTISTRTVIKSVAIFMAASLVLLMTVMMLVTTQALGVKELILEAVSALATVGVSMGITGDLDAVGKIVIMGAMFIGRIGPLTLFLLLRDRRTVQHGTYAPTEIPLA